MSISAPRAERRAFEAIVFLASIVPISAGAAGIFIGPRMLHGIATAGPDLESHFRYLSGLLLGIGLAFVACVWDLDRRAGTFRILGMIVIVGGLGRLLAAAEHGLPTGANRFAFSVELGIVPFLLIWLGRIERRRGT